MPGAHARELAARQRRAFLDVLQEHRARDPVRLERRRRTAHGTGLVACRVRARVRVRVKLLWGYRASVG